MSTFIHFLGLLISYYFNDIYNVEICPSLDPTIFFYTNDTEGVGFITEKSSTKITTLKSLEL